MRNAHPFAIFLLLGACAGSGSPTKPAGSDGGSDGGTEDSGSTDTGEPLDCEPAPAPVATTFLPGYTGAEDFAFDSEGYLVSVDTFGNLVGINQAGETRLILPDATMYAAGTRILPGGDILFCDAETGSLVRVDPSTGSSRVVLSGLEYPNGLAVDNSGMAYVAEQISGKVRRVDPDTGEYEVVATGLYNPNGVALSPDQNTLYVGSFGAGAVWEVQRDGESWAPPIVFGSTPNAPGIPPNPCEGAAEGTECPMNGGGGLGVCADDEGGGLYCQQARDTAACAGKAEGDACETLLFGEPLEQQCAASETGELFCPKVPATHTKACRGIAEYEACSVSTNTGICAPTYEGVNACYLDSAFVEVYTSACEGLDMGATCNLRDSHYPTVGTCEDGSSLGVDATICLPPGWLLEYGGLDGVAVDHCGGVYVTEYIQGKVYRMPGGDSPPELIAQLPTDWIPNLHWGNGVGGWDTNTLYVMDRSSPGVFALEVGVPGPSR